ncbi:coenzyme F420-0:L-glutamate ligase [Calidifontibacter sp. DB0510]|uniref:Coenzyme F420-0:L-glutamate ligase n=1 Tax=Metallococcus carri TaxID=1656884 RepID=A0A967AZP7_9MICO|nr:coenzyme F420-0:L-glutamate ligase [Metallococcus carri]NHN54580.1 coenzyme F420-0:L-glutamate ligase [Metallococcus carri]NOP36581.1 coenzyme F420-0:L-glutamate ligase [Calidifontibacter sp. DB2511S]
MITLLPVPGLPEIGAGDDLGALVADAIEVRDGDIVVVTSKVVSKALGLRADSTESTDRPALALRESRRVVAERMTSTGGVTRVVEALAGPVMAGAGIDASNADDDHLLLLPHDPDAAAQEVLDSLRAATGVGGLAVILSDTAGRPWRAGLVDFALGTAGLRALDDLRGHADAAGRDLAVTVRNLADELAAAADLVKGKLDRVPVAIVRGMPDLVAEVPAVDLVRSGPEDWFALGRAEAVRDALGVPAGSQLSQDVGIESVHPETIADRAARALRVASSAERAPSAARAGTTRRASSITARGEAVVIRLEDADPVRLGHTWARVEVALAGERLGADATRDGTTVEIVVRPTRR